MPIKNAFTTVSLAVVAAAAVLTGCNAVNTSPAPSVSIYKDVTSGIPTRYYLSATNNVVGVQVDRTNAGVVLSATLNEYEMPTVWAKAVLSGSTYSINGTTVDPVGTDASWFVLYSGSYYAKWISLGATGSTTVLTFSAGAYSGSYVDSSGATVSVTLPDVNLSADAKSWYYTQMSKGDFIVAKNASASFTVSAGTATTWSKASEDATWQAARDKAVQFVYHKVLTGADSLSVTKNTSTSTWFVGVDDTGVDSTWGFDSYFPDLVKAHADTSTSSGTSTSGTDATAGASS